MGQVKRRDFLKATSAAGFGLFALPVWASFNGCGSCPTGGPAPEGDGHVFADLHAHPSIDQWISGSPSAKRSPFLREALRTELNVTKICWRALHEARVDFVCAAHFNLFDEWFSMPNDPNPEAPQNTFQMMEQLERELAGPAAPYANIARNVEELDALLKVPRKSDAYRIAVVHSLEGGHALGGDLEVLEEFAAKGVAYITVTHFFNKGIASAPNAIPFFPDSNSEWPKQGLSDYGRDVVAEMERLGIIVDATHLSATALVDLFGVTKKPFIASHSSARVLGDHAYSFFDEHIVEIAQRGGLLGIVLSPHLLSNYGDEISSHKYGSLLDVVRTIQHVVKICGTHKCVGIGSDFGGYITGPREMTWLSQIHRLRERLSDEFGDKEIVDDIMFNNVIGFLLKHWGRVNG